MHTRVAGSTGLNVKVIRLDEFCKWHAFTPKGRKTCFKILSSRELSTSMFSDTQLQSSDLIIFLAQQVCELLTCPFFFWHFPSVPSFTPSLQGYAIPITLAIAVPSSCLPLCSKQPMFPFAFFICMLLFGLFSLCVWFLCQAPSQTCHESIPSPDTQLCPMSDSGLLYT